MDQVVAAVEKDDEKVVPKISPFRALQKVSDLGSGAYGKVYMVMNEKGETFALKTVKKSEEYGFNYSSSMRELSALATFQGHPNIIRVFDSFVNPNKEKYSILMELMNGDLKHFWKSHKLPYRLAHFQSMAQQILSGLAYLHSEGFAHRDIKSQNIFYEETDGCIKVKVSLFFYGGRVLTSFSLVGRLWID